ncbi:MAG: ABC transporter substrate-binding protein [Candidatus Alkaliphilus sp. MAG34]
MKNFKKVIAFMLLISVIFTFTACGFGKSNESGELDKPGDSSAPVVTEPEKIKITDVMGREVVLDEPAKKIVGTHNPSVSPAIVLGGGGKYIAGLGNKDMCRELYTLVIDDYDDIIQIGKGKQINLETVESVGADLAVFPERFKDVVEEFGKIDVPIIVALPNDESFDTVKKTLSIVGKALGEDERADKINAFFDKKIADAKAVSAKAKDKQKVLFLGSSSPLSVAPDAMIQTQLIEAAGGINAVSGVDVKGEFADVNIEQIIAWNPDVIWCPAYAKYTIESLLKDPAWSGIKAIKNKAIYEFPSALEPWDYPTASVALGVSWATHNLHPDLHSLDDLKKDADEFYNLVYGKTFTLEQMGLK